MLSRHYCLQRTCKDGEERPSQVLLVDKKNQEKVTLQISAALNCISIDFENNLMV